MKHTSRSSRNIRRAALCALLCVSLLLMTGCGRKEETIITVYSTPNTMVDTSQQVPTAVTAEPTAIPTVDPNSDEDVAWALDGLDTAPEVTAAPNEQAADVTIGYVARENNAIGPYECTERDLVSINQLMYESVVELDSEQKPTPLLADRWSYEINDDGVTVWTFELRSGIQFHNGATLTAMDVINSYTAIAAAGENNPYADHAKLIRTMEYVTDTVFRVYARYPGIITLYGMTFPVIQSDTIYTSTPRGTGPYWLIAYEPGNYIRLESNPLWWKRSGDVTSILCKNYANTASALLALNSGDIDMLSSRSYSASQTRNLSDMLAMDYTTNTYEMMVPNLSSGSLMSDLDLRKAIMYAIDRTGVQTNGYLSMLQSSEVPVIPGTWLYETQSAVYYYSPERALQILYDDGWGDSNGDGILDRVRDGLLQELSISIITYSEDTVSARINAAKKIAEDLSAIGIRVEVLSGAQSDIKSAIKAGDFDLALVGVNMSVVPNPAVLVDSEGELNISQYVDMDMDTLCDAIQTAADETSLKSIFSDIQMKIVEDLPIMGLGYHTGAVISHTSLNGLSGIREYDAWNGLETMVLYE